MPVAECLTRRGLDWTHQYPAIHAAVLVLGIREAYLDGGQKQPPRSVRANEFSSTAFSFADGNGRSDRDSDHDHGA